MSVTAINSTSASALALLTGSAKALQATQTQVASGLRVREAADNAAYWSIATTGRAHSISLSSADDATGLAAAVADTAALGVEAAAGIVSEIQSRLILAQSTDVGRGAINDEITALKDQLKSIASAGSFNGQNWLEMGVNQRPKIESMVASITDDGKNGTSVNVIDFDTAKSTLISREEADDGILTRSYSGTTRSGNAYDYYLVDVGSAVPASFGAKEIEVSEDTTYDELEGMVSSVNAMFARLADAGSSIGATRNRISASSDMLKDLQDVTQMGIGRLVDADMGQQAVLLRAQEAQVQLQTQALNIANNSAGMLKALFV
ncbi:flagellin [Rhizobium sp. RU36D]|uniref:flagellin N-terminal helical domain-containing protein n=1 Tax=Rhizobium sp. RU36D TaxID=1907415 RepID=UPI0009D8D6E2|nr:flagellin [Rhizobium sp. RU36D]SMC62100.1 flagellin [Rhizobium sp. RU36D]